MGSVAQAMDAFFSPRITLKALDGGRFTYDKVDDFRLFKQFKQEAGIKGLGLKEADYDRFLTAASEHGYSVEVIEL